MLAGALGARLRYTAQGVGSLGGNTRQFTAGTVADAEWTGAAASSFSAFGANLGDGAGGAEGPLARMASAVETYAGYLRTAQQKAQQFNFIANEAENDPTGAVMSAVEQASRSATEAASAAQRAGDQAAAEVASASDQLQSLFGDGPVQRFIVAQPGVRFGGAVTPQQWEMV